MKRKISYIIAFSILVLPVIFYAVFKSPHSSYVSAHINKPEIIEFYTPLCSECQKMKNTINIVEPKYERDIIFTKIDASVQDEYVTALVRKYNVHVVPTTVFIDKKGAIHLRAEGAMTEASFTKRIKELLK